MGDFKIHVLASGSKGNATVLQAGSTSVLIDAGISARRITAALAGLGLRPDDLSGVLVTHEHTDHISGLPVFCKKNAVPVFANERTWFASGIIGKLTPFVRRLLPEDGMRIGDLEIKSFGISHDAASPVGFNFYYRDSKCSFVTDTGYAGESVTEAMQGSDAIVLEANHDAQMLQDGSYPQYLKERIKGRRGHLSNVEAGELLCKVMDGRKTEVFLAHLSQENNCPDVARRTVTDILRQRGLAQNADIYVARQEQLVSNCVKGE